MKVVGIDLSGPRNFADTCLVSFEEEGNEIRLKEVRQGVSDDQIVAAIRSLRKEDRITIGIDAPLSYNSTGGDRPSDKDLRDRVKTKGGAVAVMPPTLTRMVYLTLRGITLARLLESLQYDLRIVEVHPGACMLLRDASASDVRRFKNDASARRRLLHWLAEHGVQGLSREESVSDHYVAACAAALGAWQWGLGKSVWHFTADPPHHPYDFAC